MVAGSEGEGEGVPKKLLSSSCEAIFILLDLEGIRGDGLSAISAAVTMSLDEGVKNLILLFQLRNLKESGKTHFLCTSGSSPSSSET